MRPMNAVPWVPVLPGAASQGNLPGAANLWNWLLHAICLWQTHFLCAQVTADASPHRLTAPTLLYMPHCPTALADATLAANADRLCQLAVFGNSFTAIDAQWAQMPQKLKQSKVASTDACLARQYICLTRTECVTGDLAVVLDTQAGGCPETHMCH